MKIFILISLVFVSSVFAMPVYEFTDSNVFNAMYSLFINIAVIIVPMFGAISLLRN